MMFMVPISMIGEGELIAKRAELEDKMKNQGYLTHSEASYLDGIVSELNRRRGIQ